MKTLIIYDSIYGNTGEIAKAIGSAIAGDVQVLRVGSANASELKSVELLIVGSPTVGFRPIKPVQDFINGITRDTLKGVNVAAFDTRIQASETGKGLRFIMKVGCYAAPRILHDLAKKGGKQVAEPEGFFVKDKEGPLKDGESQRAVNWADSIVRDLITKY